MKKHRVKGAENGLFYKLLEDCRHCYSSIVDSDFIGVVITDSEGRFSYVNATFASMLGFEQEELTGVNISSIMNSEDYKQFNEVKTLSGDEVPLKMSTLLRCKEGIEIDVLLSISPLFDLNGDFLGSLVMAVDVTERTWAERESEKRRVFLETVLDTVNDAIIVCDREGRIVDWNRGACKLFGFEKDEVFGYEADSIIRDEDGNEAKDFSRVLESGESFTSLEVLRSGKGGNCVDVMASGSRLESEGELIGAVVVYTDISALRRAEEELKKEHWYNENLINTVKLIVIEIDGKGKVVRWNRFAEEHLGKPASLVLGKRLEEIDIDWNWRDLKKLISEFKDGDGRMKKCEIPVKTREGRTSYFYFFISRGIQSNGTRGLIFVGSDVTETVELKNQLAQSQKLESIGRLAAGIAHEINTPTQYVGDNVRFLSEAFEDLFRLLDRYEEVVGEGEKGELEVLKEEVDLEYLREEVPRAIEQSLDGVERVTKIVRSMKEFSHPGGGGKELVDLNRAIESTVTVARNEWKYVAELELDLEEGLPAVPCYVGEFNQVVLNLVINAVHAIEEVVGDGSGGKGRIVVSTRRDGEWVEVRVSDSGCGIPEEVREKVFEPFFTTKGVGKGTGQGLAIARSVVVDKHGGEISFESEVGKGTTFIIRLPLNAEENADREVHRVNAGTGTIISR